MTLMLSATIFYSCSRDETPEEKKEQEDKKVEDWESEDIDGDATMSSQVMRFSVGNIPSITRGITPFSGASYSFSVGDRITIELTRDDVVVDTKVYKVTNTDGDLEFDYDNYPTGQPFYLENKTDFQLRAWSYGNSTPFATNPVGNSFILNTDQRTNTTTDNYTELLYSPKQTYSYSTEKIPITLYHQMARLKVTLTHEASGNLSVDYVKIGNSSIPTTATFSESGIDIENDDFIGTWTGHGTANGQVYARADVANENYTAVLFPNTSLSGQLIKVVTDNETKTYAYTLPSSVSFNPGNQYSYTITVKDNTGHATSIANATVSNIHVGDILCSDGTIYHADIAATSITANSKTPVGVIVFVNSKDHDIAIFNTAGDAATEKGLGKNATKSQGRALVLCLKNSSNGCKWRTGSSAYGSVFVVSGGNYVDPTLSTYAEHYKGFTRTQGMNSSSYPAAQSAYNYTGLTAPSNSTGWFFPSAGQWRLVIAGLTDYKYLNQNQYNSNASNNTGTNSAYTTSYLAGQINTAMSNAGAGKYTAISTGSSNDLIWNCSEYSSSYASAMRFNNPSGGTWLGYIGDPTSNSFYVRPVLAF